MPELPEVETIRASLHPLVVGRVVDRVELRSPRLRLPLDAGLARAVAGRRVSGTSRRGKYLMLDLDDGRSWIFHMGMSGRLRFEEGAGLVGARHDHVIAHFRGGGGLVFHDPRRFGLTLVDDAVTCRLLEGMGPEPLDREHFHAEYLATFRRRTRRSAKDVLMDQRVVAGLGNIYVNEILFRAGVRPRRAMPRTTLDECARLVDATRDVIATAIRERGSTISDFVDGTGRRGGYQGHHMVYDRRGEPCPRCGAAIRCVIVGQRSSFYCPSCQR